MSTNNFPKLHNAGWPGVVGKGPDAEEPFIDLDTMLDLTAAAEVNGARFDGVDLFLSAPHVDIDSTPEDLKQLAEKLQSRGLVIGSVVAPVWPPTGGGPATGNADERAKFVEMVRKACGIGKTLRELGVPAVWRRADRLRRGRRQLERRSSRQHKEDRRDLPRSLRRR